MQCITHCDGAPLLHTPYMLTCCHCQASLTCLEGDECVVGVAGGGGRQGGANLLQL